MNQPYNWEPMAIVGAAVVAVVLTSRITRRFGYDSGYVTMAVFLVIAIILGVRGTWKVIRRRQAFFRGREGQCPTYGYDLRESPDRCPECGETERGVAADSFGDSEPEDPFRYAAIITVIAGGTAWAIMFYAATAQSGH